MPVVPETPAPGPRQKPQILAAALVHPRLTPKLKSRPRRNSCAGRVLNFDREEKGDPELEGFTVLFLLSVGDRILVLPIYGVG
jgi:hypothetical protein